MGVSFALAGPGDEAEIRCLLRDNPMGEGWRIALIREPDGMGGPHWPGERRHFVLARDAASGEAVGLCERVVRPAFVAGEPRLLPYLGALRVARSHRHRIAVLRGGFAALRAVERPDELPFALTSIAADNAPARRLLTAGVTGLPVYRPAGGFVTRMMRARRHRVPAGIARAAPSDWPELAAFLQASMRPRPFAPVWDEAALAAFGGIEWLVRRKGGAIAGAVGLWDQRASRQAVVRALPPSLGRWRHAANLVAPMLGLPAIPAPGCTIAQGFLCALATADDDPASTIALVTAGIDAAARAGLRVATLGLPAGHDWLPALRRRFRAVEYETQLFAVHWPEAAREVESLAPASGFPEVALL